jgi:hypothetical protein
LGRAGLGESMGILRSEESKSGMIETVEKGKSVWENRTLKLLIVLVVFPVLVLAFHVLLMLPAFFVDSLLVRVGGHPKFWAKTLSIIALLPACWGAVAICKWIWPGSK